MVPISLNLIDTGSKLQHGCPYTVEIKDDLKAWIVACSIKGSLPRDDILIQGNAHFHSMFGSTCQVGSLKRGWLDRFME
jgi:hypothetical protein